MEETSQDTLELEFSAKLDKYIRQIVAKEGYIHYEVDKKRILTKGNNYCGILYELDVKGRTNEGDKELNIFVKCMKEFKESLTSVLDFYKGELFAYQEISRIYAELQEEANIPEDQRYPMVKCYEQSDMEAILMDNIVRKGFKPFNRMVVPSLQTAVIFIKQLARFHGLSFALRERRPEYFNKNIKPLKYPMKFNDKWSTIFAFLRDSVREKLDEKYKETVNEAYDGMLERYVRYFDDETINVCLCHGDYKSNNIMVKVENGEVQQAIPIDYQIIHCGSPVYDFLFFLYLSTDRKFRQDHTSYLKDLYYETFRKFLGYFELDADVIYSRDEFEKVYREKLDLGLIIALFLLPFTLASEDEQAETPNYETDYSFKERMEGVLDDYVDWGYL